MPVNNMPSYGIAGYKPGLPGNQMTQGRMLDAGRMPTTGIGALQRLTNPGMPPQALVREVAMPGPASFPQSQQRQVVSGTLAARALQAQPMAQPAARLDQLRGTFAPQTVKPEQLSLPGPQPQPKYNPADLSLPGPQPQPKYNPADLSLPGPNPYGVNPMGTYTPPGLNQTIQMQGAPKYQPPGIVPQFQMSQMAYRPPQPASLGKPFTGTYQGPNTNQAQQLAAQQARNK